MTSFNMSDKVIQQIQKQLHRTKHINSLNSNGENVLHQAVQRHSCVRVVEYLLTRGADLKCTTGVGANVMHLAVMNLNHSNFRSILKLFKFLISKKINVNASDAEGDSVLHYLVRNTKNADLTVSLVSLLLESHACINASNRLGQTALYLAVESGNLALSKFLISAGANVNSATKELKSVLQISVEKCNLEITKLLLQKNARLARNINNQDSLLHIAIKSTQPGKSRMDLIETLLESGTDVNAVDDSLSTPLHLSLQMRDDYCSKLLVNYGACVNSLNRCKHTPLWIAVENQLLDSVKLLLLRGANPNFIRMVSKNDDITSLRNQESVLNKAVFSGSFPAVQLLVKFGADTTTLHQNNYNLGLAICISHTAMAEFFLKQGANVNDTSCGFRAPLFCALECDASVRGNLIQILLDYGADYNMLENSDTPLVMAWRGSRSGTKNVLCLIRHLALLTEEGHDIGEMNFSVIDQEPLYTYYFLHCIRELRLMKSHKLTRCHVTPYDLLTKKENDLVVHFRNEMIVNFIQKDNVSKSYPTYSWNLRRNYAKAQERGRLMNRAKRFFNACAPSRIPPEIVILICTHLSDNDLENLSESGLRRPELPKQTAMTLRKGSKPRNFYRELDREHCADY